MRNTPGQGFPSALAASDLQATLIGSECGGKPQHVPPLLIVNGKKLLEQSRQTLDRNIFALVGDRDCHVNAILDSGRPDSGRLVRALGQPQALSEATS